MLRAQGWMGGNVLGRGNASKDHEPLAAHSRRGTHPRDGQHLLLGLDAAARARRYGGGNIRMQLRQAKGIAVL